jgi:nitroimidazol reductase NimA-like FMN-containing flavoprotein (pyridoxamine 5'-phosphate oxidase superfamily)
MEEARIATSHADVPHVKPVSFIYHDGVIFVATDYTTRTFKNIKINPKVSVVIDVYKPKKHKAICVQGKTEIVEQGSEFLNIYKIFEKKFSWVRDDPWQENEAPFIRIIATNKKSWGI